jgi:hypothetical protein
LRVEALCVLQDSAEDKAFEIDRMGSLYKNSTLTFVAASARSANEGFLKIRDEPEYYKLPVLLPNSPIGTAHAMRMTDHHPVAPLDSRGWALKDWVLSPRKLCYGEKELLWCCEAGYLKKVTPSLLTLVNTGLTTSSLMGEAPGANFHQRDYVPPEGITRLLQWQHILEDVTAVSLTVNNDRLDAVLSTNSNLYGATTARMACSTTPFSSS